MLIRNEVVNPSCEASVSNGWTIEGTATRTRVSTKPKFGSWHWRIVTAAIPASGQYTALLAAAGGSQWTASCYVAAEDGTAVGHPIRLDLLEYNSSSILIRTNTVTINLTTDYQRAVNAVTLLSNTAFIRVALRQNAAVSRVYFLDGVMLHTGVQAVPYFDGSQPGFEWTGTANNSASQQSAAPKYRVREMPPLKETIMITTPGGKQFRWSEDDPLPDRNPSGVSSGNSMPGGHSNFDAALPRKTEIDYSDIDRLSKIEQFDYSGRKIWEGYLERAARSDGDYLTVSPGAVGYQKMLEDNQGINWLGVDIDQTTWEGISLGRQVLLRAFTQMPVDGSPGIDESQTLQALELLLTGPWANPTIAEMWYKAPPGQIIGSIDYDFASSSALAGQPSASFEAYVGGADDNGVGTNSVSTTDLQTGVASTATGSISINRKWGFVRWSIAGANATAGEYLGRFIVGVVGNHGLPRYSDGATKFRGLLSSDVLKELIDRHVPELHYDSDSIQNSTFVIPQSVGRNTTVAAILEDHNKYERWDWAVWDDKKVFYHPPRARKSWVARVGPSRLEETGKDVRRLCNGVYVSYRDVDGSQRVVGPPGSGADIESSLCKDPDPNNEATLSGREMYHSVQMRDVSTPIGAATVGQYYINELKLLDRSGNATITGWVQSVNGPWHPYTSIRSGDDISFVDAADPAPRRIVEVQYSRDSREANITLDAPDEGIEAILDRLQLSLQGLAT